MKDKKEKLIVKRAILSDARNAALKRKNYQRFNELSTEIEAVTRQMIELDDRPKLKISTGGEVIVIK